MNPMPNLKNRAQRQRTVEDDRGRQQARAAEGGIPCRGTGPVAWDGTSRGRQRAAEGRPGSSDNCAGAGPADASEEGRCRPGGCMAANISDVGSEDEEVGDAVRGWRCGRSGIRR